ncbi:MAG: hypothetical protein LBL04_09560 [Bacteroidales bacterium]|jgi:hypothetical protein|nr:hypothetical protein [Bacteroidales bacterium]
MTKKTITIPQMITVKRTNSEDGDFRRLVEMLDVYLDDPDRTAHSACKTFNRIDTVRYVVVAYSAAEASVLKRI